MTHSFSGFRALIAGAALALMISAAPAGAQQQPPKVERPARPAPAAAAMDANGTRQDLMELLRKHPPSVARVLKLDPSLMRSEAYLADYPELRDFLALHPEIPQNSQFFLELVQGSGHEDYRPHSPQLEMAQGILAGLAGFTAAAIVLGTLVWLIRTVLDQRRWSRLSKIQAEVHSKLMDRFSNNDELLTYVQTPSGRRFLESGPSPLPETTAVMAAPVSRILWSLQAGAVLLFAGLGLLFLTGRAVPEAADFFYVAGSIAGALGAGFLVSAAAAYLLSRKLGLLDRPAANPAHDNA
jgi:hypothetical protein